MKVLVVGLGSMGKRRIRNLQALGVADIAGMDLRDDRRREAAERYGVRTFVSLDEGLQWRPEAMVISLPPDLHAPYALRAAEARIPFFTEAGVPDDRWPAVRQAMEELDVVGVPSCTMRYYPGPKRVREVLANGDIGRPLLWQYHSGQYLPDWHPWETIESYYVSKRETGGCREIVAFELVWLLQIFGPVAGVQGDRGKLSDLPVDIDDAYHLQLQHANGVKGQLTVDVLARSPVRQLRVVGTDGTLEWENSRKEIRVYQAADKVWQDMSLSDGTVEKGYVNPEEPYIHEMDDFLRSVRREAPPPYTFGEDAAILEVLVAAERSADTGERIAPAGASIVTVL